MFSRLHKIGVRLHIESENDECFKAIDELLNRAKTWMDHYNLNFGTKEKLSATLSDSENREQIVEECLKLYTEAEVSASI